VGGIGQRALSVFFTQRKAMGGWESDLILLQKFGDFQLFQLDAGPFVDPDPAAAPLGFGSTLAFFPAFGTVIPAFRQKSAQTKQLTSIFSGTPIRGCAFDLGHDQPPCSTEPFGLDLSPIHIG
jgi:hypothetical protein